MSRQQVAELGDRHDILHRRLEAVDQATAERLEELTARAAELAGRQTSAEACLIDVDVVLKALARQLAVVTERGSAADAVAHRVEYLERRATALQDEIDTAGALAATAVAAADEVEVLGPTLRELRRQLLELAQQLQDEVRSLKRRWPMAPGERPSAADDAQVRVT